MDQLDIKSLRPRMVHVMQSHIGSLKAQKQLAPSDTVDLGRRSQPEPPTAANVPLPPAEVGLAPVVAALQLPPAMSEQDLLQALLEDVPEELLAAARQILKSQMKSKTQPSRSLRFQKQVDSFGHIQDRADGVSVLDQIMDSAPPLLDE